MTIEYSDIVRLVKKEGLFLDNKEWDKWLDCYEEDAIIWMPMWKNEKQLNYDPYLELSFFFLNGKNELKERVDRVVSGLSVASMPAPRTCHKINTIDIEKNNEEFWVVSSWSSHIYNHKDKIVTSYFGQYNHKIIVRDSKALIKKKKIILINDYLESNLEFYYV